MRRASAMRCLTSGLCQKSRCAAAAFYGLSSLIKKPGAEWVSLLSGGVVWARLVWRRLVWGRLVWGRLVWGRLVWGRVSDPSSRAQLGISEIVFVLNRERPIQKRSSWRFA